MAKNDVKLASVLAFERKLVVSDGYMYGTTWDERADAKKVTPIKLIEKSVRGTISNRLKNAVKNDPLKLNAEVEKANLQTVDSASLSMTQDTLKVKFSLKVLSGFQFPSVCNLESHQKCIQDMGEKYIATYGCKDLAHRYATNIVNGRFLWRNRVGADKVEVVVHLPKQATVSNEESLTFNSYDYNMKNFDKHDEQMGKLANLIADALSGKTDYLLLEVEANVLMGDGQEVYPSEELVLDKGKGKKSKVLYQVDGGAALHSQKIGNALRTIDTWYPEYAHVDSRGPIAVEPYGAVTTLGRAFRTPKDKVDFYTLFDRWSQGEALEEREEEFVVAVLIRGGVFGASGKE